jgi:hypothetical protein
MFPNLLRMDIPITGKIIEHLRLETIFHVTGAIRVAAGMIGNILELLENVGIHMTLQLFGSVSLVFDIGIVMIQDIL